MAFLFQRGRSTQAGTRLGSNGSDGGGDGGNGGGGGGGGGGSSGRSVSASQQTSHAILQSAMKRMPQDDPEYDQLKNLWKLPLNPQLEHILDIFGMFLDPDTGGVVVKVNNLPTGLSVSTSPEHCDVSMTARDTLKAAHVVFVAHCGGFVHPENRKTQVRFGNCTLMTTTSGAVSSNGGSSILGHVANTMVFLLLQSRMPGGTRFTHFQNLGARDESCSVTSPFTINTQALTQEERGWYLTQKEFAGAIGQVEGRADRGQNGSATVFKTGEVILSGSMQHSAFSAFAMECLGLFQEFSSGVSLYGIQKLILMNKGALIYDGEKDDSGIRKRRALAGPGMIMAVCPRPELPTVALPLPTPAAMAAPFNAMAHGGVAERVQATLRTLCPFITKVSLNLSDDSKLSQLYSALTSIRSHKEPITQMCEGRNHTPFHVPAPGTSRLDHASGQRRRKPRAVQGHKKQTEPRTRKVGQRKPRVSTPRIKLEGGATQGAPKLCIAPVLNTDGKDAELGTIAPVPSTLSASKKRARATSIKTERLFDALCPAMPTVARYDWGTAPHKRVKTQACNLSTKPPPVLCVEDELFWL